MKEKDRFEVLFTKMGKMRYMNHEQNRQGVYPRSDTKPRTGQFEKKRKAMGSSRHSHGWVKKSYVIATRLF
jgi:hypothetical protein